MRRIEACLRRQASRRSQALSPVYTGETPSGSTEPFGSELRAELLTAEILRAGGGFIQTSRKIMELAPWMKAKQ